MSEKNLHEKSKKSPSVDRGFLRLLAAVVEAPEEMVLATFLAKRQPVSAQG